MGTQSDIFNKYRALQKADSVAPLDNVNNKRLDNMPFVEFLFELLKTTQGQSRFKNVVLKGVLSDLKTSTDIDNEIKNIAKDNLFSGYVGTITSDMTTAGNGIDIRLPEIDPFNLMNVDPDSDVGRHFYEGNNSSTNINYIFHKAQNRSVDNPLLYTKNGKTLMSVYAVNPTTVNCSFGEYYQGKSFREWFDDYNTNLNYFNLPNFFSMLLDVITGSLSVKSNKSQNQIKKENRLIRALKKIFGYCSVNNDGNLPRASLKGIPLLDLTGDDFNKKLEQGEYIVMDDGNGGSSVDDGDPFDFTSEELYDIDAESKRLFENKLRFLTCGNLDMDVDADQLLDGLNGLLSDITTNETNDDGQLIYNNDNKSVNVDAAIALLESIVDSGAKSLEIQGEDDVIVDVPNMKSEFEMNILKQIPYALMKLILTPKMLSVFKLGEIVNRISTDSTNTKLIFDANVGFNQLRIPLEKIHFYKADHKIDLNGDIYTLIDIDVSGGILFLNRILTLDYPTGTIVKNLSLGNVSVNTDSNINKLKGVINGIGVTITDKILGNIFDMIKAEFTKLGKTLIKKALLQRLSDYQLVLSSLLTLLGLLKLLKREQCSSMLSKIVGLLDTNIPKPAIPMPPMLTLFAGALKPGMNEVVAINEMKGKLEKYGINTAQINADGSPNTYILGLEAVMSTMIKHIKSSANIQTEVISAVGPAKGFSQIQ